MKVSCALCGGLQGEPNQPQGKFHCLKCKLQRVRNALTKYYCRELAEALHDGTPFDRDVLDRINKVFTE